MFQFTGYLPARLCVHRAVTGCVAGRVPPFGDRRVFASLQLTAAFRSLARPSSVSSGKASSVRPSLLNQWFSTFSCFFRDVSKKTVITVSVSSYNFYVIDLFCYVFSFDVVQFSKIDPEVSKQIPQNQTEYLQVQNNFFTYTLFLLRKEVIHPHVPVGIPCYDLTPVIDPTFDGSLPEWVMPPASGITNSHGLTGGVYKARERIHRDMLIRDY